MMDNDLENNSKSTAKDVDAFPAAAAAVAAPPTTTTPSTASKSNLSIIRVHASIFLLFLNFFLAQYDKFVLAYFQNSVIAGLSLSAPQYGLLSGYSTGIVYALLAIPLAYVADYTQARVWVLVIAALWWSLCVVFQGLARTFSHLFMARIGMGIGQSCVEALSISLISDFVGWRNVFLGNSVFYVGVYIGEAVSGQIATAFEKSGTSWQVALRAIGIVGIVVAILLRLVLREPKRQLSLIEGARAQLPAQTIAASPESANVTDSTKLPAFSREKLKMAKVDLQKTIRYVLQMHSFWLLTISASFRLLSGNVFGFYMPGYLQNTYPSETELFSRYGIIVGVVGTFTVLSGGAITSLLWHKTKVTPLYLTGIGGMISSIFVLLMIFSKDLAQGNESDGVKILYGVMSAAYLTAELWLGALFGLVALLLPSRYKTFGFALWSSIMVLIYSSGPEIIGLALRDVDSTSAEYTDATQVALAIIIPLGYWVAGIGFLFSIRLVKKDLSSPDRADKDLSKARRWSFLTFIIALSVFVITIFVVSLVYKS